MVEPSPLFRNISVRYVPLQDSPYLKYRYTCYSARRTVFTCRWNKLKLSNVREAHKWNGKRRWEKFHHEGGVGSKGCRELFRSVASAVFIVWNKLFYWRSEDLLSISEVCIILQNLIVRSDQNGILATEKYTEIAEIFRELEGEEHDVHGDRSSSTKGSDERNEFYRKMDLVRIRRSD